MTIDVVEIDSEMVSLAEKWFGFVQGDRVKVFIQDGVLFVKEATKQGLCLKLHAKFLVCKTLNMYTDVRPQIQLAV